jgi:hypothetical protein
VSSAQVIPLSLLAYKREPHIKNSQKQNLQFFLSVCLLWYPPQVAENYPHISVMYPDQRVADPDPIIHSDEDSDPIFILTTIKEQENLGHIAKVRTYMFVVHASRTVQYLTLLNIIFSFYFEHSENKTYGNNR